MPQNDKIQQPVLLTEGKIESFSDFLNLTIEYVLFFRWAYFKNRPRGNLLLLRGLMVVSFWSAIVIQTKFDWKLILLGIDIDPIIAYFAAIGFSYYSMSSVFFKKSEACAHMYTEMIKAGGAGNTWSAKALSNALALELLTLDLWAHRKYRGLFAKNLYRAVEHAYSKNSVPVKVTIPTDMKSYIELINKGHLQAKEARILLDNYQDYLMYSMNQHFSKESKETTIVECA
jgi:hypothetical protein